MTISNKLATAALAGLLSTGMISAAFAADPAPHAKADQAKAAEATDAKTDAHACKGQNACKGKGGCKSGDAGCAGKNTCKGKGGCKTAK